MNVIRYIFTTILLLIALTGVYPQQVQVGFLTSEYPEANDPEVEAAFDFLQSNNKFNAEKLYFSDVTEPEKLERFDVIWYHFADTSETDYPELLTDILYKYVGNGGNLLLTLEAFSFINHLGIEPNPPETRHKKCKDTGYGRMLGLHAFRSHPVFEGLNGGAYIFKPIKDTTVRITGYFEDNIPQNGAVVAVDWDYIFIRENKKLIIEYNVNRGKVLAVGAYTCFSQPNLNRQHLELFITNAIDYLVSEKADLPVYYWTYYEHTVIPYESEYPEFLEREPKPWVMYEDNMLLSKGKATENYWDVAGQRMLIMGKENGGIDEVWAHPFMAFRDYEAGIKFENIDSVIWLNNMFPKIEVRPESFTRIYNFENSVIKEIISASIIEPVGVIHYEYKGEKPSEMFIKFKSNLRIMWPYSEKAFKTLRYSFNIALNGMLITDESRDFSCFIGANKEPEYQVVGQYDDFPITWYEGTNGKKFTDVNVIASDDFQAAGLFRFKLEQDEQFDIVISASNVNPEETINNYIKAISNPQNICNNTKNYYQEFLSGSLEIITPDSTFNEGYKWALIATDRFFVNTPGLGKSLVAGYSTTNSGWSGGHKICGRPGYAWYFGRDGQWSGFALLDYGDFEKVRAILEMYQKLQDLNGKIYHEVSTSGFVHYDASDATPLYLVLAGKYLRHSGDINFIRESRTNIKKAIDFCFSTDTDGDHLIENTNVGHGWVEGGSLFGSHSSLYLTSCWAAALDEAAYMANALDLTDEMKLYQKEAEIVKEIINNDFWNEEKQFFYHGKFIDETYHAEPTIMPAIPLYFGQIEKDKAVPVITEFAKNGFTSDWGCRIIKEESSLFNPKGYHTGSVWPLYTGWAALAEYNNGNYVQGFSHIMNNLLIYQNWGLGFVEEVMNGEVYEPSGVCRHQCWSETMVLQPAIEGMLGLNPDALNHTLCLSPKFPANWDSVQVKNIRIGDHFINFKKKRKNNIVTYRFTHKGPSSLKLIFDPVFPEGTIIKQLTATGNLEPKNLNTEEPAIINIDEEITLEYSIEKGIKVLPVINRPNPGDKSKGLRIIGDGLENNIYFVSLEAQSGATETFEIYVNDWKINKIENGKILSQEGDICKIQVKFDESDSKYNKQEIRIHLE
ncbi:MAG: hypothetical protein ISS18_05795 [Bacteroidales bacterium]|nr:hypothetical protein [Bacteroidales bacterium]